MRIILALLAFHFFANSGFSQTYEKYEWDESRKPVQLTADEAGQAQIMLYYHIQYEYIYEDESSPVVYHTQHKIVRVNNDNAIANNNRIYIPMKSVLDLVSIKARTITKDGRVITFNKEDIKEIKDEELGNSYKIFALEGVEAGSEIEYFFTKKMFPNYFGREYFQFTSPLKQASFKLISPENLHFEFKSYNGLTEISEDKDNEEKNIYSLTAESIPIMREEAFSSFNQNRQRLEFRLAYNTVNGRIRLNTWENIGKRVHDQAYNLSKNDKKVIDKFLKNISPEKYSTPELKAAAIEDYIKTNIYLDENRSSSEEHLEDIIKNKVASKMGITRLLVACFSQASISTAFVLTSDRDDLLFDGDFESYNYLTDYLIYLPDQKKFVAPYMPQYRIGLTPPELTATDGLFTKAVAIQDYSYPVTEVQYIPPLTAEDNHDNMDIQVSFSEDLSSNHIVLKRSFKGYQASYIKAIYPYIEQKNKDEILKELVKFLTPDADIDQLAFESTDFNFRNWNEPLVLNSNFDTQAFIEKAGETILLKAGELIGPQSELYDTDERLTAVSNDHNRSYLRKIVIDLPDGYQIQNLNDLKINEEVSETGNDPIYAFHSDYSLEEGKLTIEINEYYREIYYPKDKFEAFRKVINAAADFNKVVLVMKRI